jgi:hypothetical protein
MQITTTFEPVPHFHRIPTVSTTNMGRYFYFRDDGVLFVGDNEYDAIEVRASLGVPVKILFEDMQDAFRLGIAVGVLREKQHSDCETVLGKSYDPTLPVMAG